MKNYRPLSQKDYDTFFAIITRAGLSELEHLEKYLRQELVKRHRESIANSMLNVIGDYKATINNVASKIPKGARTAVRKELNALTESIKWRLR